MHDRFHLPIFFGTIAAGIYGVVLFASTIGSAHAQAAGSDPVARGAYLAAAGDCVSCHTRPGGEPFSGGLPFKTPFGTLYSANITSDTETGIGSWTEEQFIRALREGVAANGDQLYPAFPYTAYSKVTDEDAKALYAYIKSLKAVKYTPPKNEMPFPFNIRATLIVWNKLFFKEGRFTPDSTKSADWNRGAYLVEGLGHCGACHTPRNSLGGEKTEEALTGGSYMDAIEDAVEETEIVKLDNTVRPWSAANLTPDATGLKAWSADQIVAYLKTGHVTKAGAFGPMSQVVNNSTTDLNDADLKAIAVYLTGIPAMNTDKATPATADQVAKGEIVYTVRCGDCHLPTGLGITEDSESAEKRAPPLVGNPVVQAPDPATLLNVILYGAHEKVMDDKHWPKMPGFGNEIGFEDEQIANLCSYLRNAWTNKGASGCTAAQVAKQR